MRAGTKICSRTFTFIFVKQNVPVNLPGRVVVECLPALVGAAPVVGGAHPPAVPAVQVPGVVVAHDHPVPLTNKKQ